MFNLFIKGSYIINKSLKSQDPIDRKFHGHGKNDGFVLYEYIIEKNPVVFANIQTSAL